MLSYQEWLTTVPTEITADSVWKVAAYRYALYLGDLAWDDVTLLMGDRRTLRVADQLYRAAGSIHANISEGYSRGTGRDRARFYEYALGSARETRDWYWRGRHILGAETTRHRVRLAATILRLLLEMIPQQRNSVIRDGEAHYDTSETLYDAGTINSDHLPATDGSPE